MCITDDNATANTTGSANQPSNTPCIRLWTVFLLFIYLFIIINNLFIHLLFVSLFVFMFCLGRATRLVTCVHRQLFLLALCIFWKFVLLFIYLTAPPPPRLGFGV